MRPRGTSAAARLLALAAALSCALVAPSCTMEKTSAGPAPAAPSSADLPFDIALRGKQLRRAFDREYQERKAIHQLHPSGTGINDFRPVVQKYIPLGTSFEDAVGILTAAGFTVGAPQKTAWGPFISRAGTIDHYDDILFTRVVASIYLVPRDKDDWSIVYAVVAQVTIDSL